MVLSFLINNAFHIGTRFFEVKKYVFSMFYNFKKNLWLVNTLYLGGGGKADLED